MQKFVSQIPFGSSLVILAIAGVALVALVGCSDSTSSGHRHFAVHEWGVMVGCEEDDSFFVTSRPLEVLAVDIPVIYFHSTEKEPFDVGIRFNCGKPCATYPEAYVSSDSIVWNDVRFSQAADPTSDSATDGYVPLQYIIGTLNDVDADMLRHRGVDSRFLFYEGNSGFRNEIAHTPGESGEVVFKNRSDYTCHDVMLVGKLNLFIPDEVPDPFPMLFFASIDSLMPGQELSAEYDTLFDDPDIASDLIELGFTQSEANSFVQLWSGPFFRIYDFYDPEVRGHLVYRLPQSEYDRLINLDIEPAPDEIIRAMYVLVRLH